MPITPESLVYNCTLYSVQYISVYYGRKLRAYSFRQFRPNPENLSLRVPVCLWAYIYCIWEGAWCLYLWGCLWCLYLWECLYFWVCGGISTTEGALPLRLCMVSLSMRPWGCVWYLDLWGCVRYLCIPEGMFGISLSVRVCVVSLYPWGCVWYLTVPKGVCVVSLCPWR